MKLFNEIIKNLTYFCSQNAINYAIMIVTLAILTSLIVVFIVSVIKKTAVDYSAFKYLVSALLIVNLGLTVAEFSFRVESFKSVTAVIVFNALIVSIALIFASVLTAISIKKSRQSVSESNFVDGKNEGVLNTATTENENRNVIRVKCVSPSGYGGDFDGFLDVSYLKSLLSLLREKDLTEADLNELDEFEVYLMNFASRQPYKSERVKLSGYLSDFMKKLARYNAQ